ncbi:hypothetical protein KIH31_05335 [Paenarthrobacter sp. DKR-5]|uniref:hypothetical protein n=1 Tax=Paenarthrobacter sp. DKR-5 TaxID=2835535 RepID=UPI001BDD1B21|nr:hypothetical protein [Paenarthrobacter sp. DKR-5]MBT1002021.1 hypothetical protein [Paenarthrobacter sp. DKR-5]
MNPDLTFTNGGVAPTAGGPDLLLSDGKALAKGVSDLAQPKGKDSAGRSARLSLGWEGTLPKPELRGRKAVYAAPAASASLQGSKPADITVEATRYGFSHTVTLARPPQSRLELRFPLTLSPGPQVQVAKTGAINVTDMRGRIVFFAPRPMMWDTHKDEHSGLNSHQAPVDARIEKTGNTPVLVLTPPASFLSDPSTSYPVTVDPSWSSAVSGDTWVQTDATPPQDGSGDLRAGDDPPTVRSKAGITVGHEDLLIVGCVVTTNLRGPHLFTMQPTS